MSDTFGLYAKYYNLLYDDKDYSAEVDYVIKQLKRFAPTAKSILEFGSGTGKHGMLLQKEGYDVFGLERSEAMVAEARLKGFECQVTDISDFELKEKYDAVISLFHVVSYITNNVALINTFINACKHLNRQGIFLFDVWYTPAVYEQKALPRIKKMQNGELAVTRLADPKIDVNSNIVDVQFTVFAKELDTGKASELFESHPMRHFSIPEIGLVAEMTGFEILKAEEFLTGNVPSVKTWGVCFILKKK